MKLIKRHSLGWRERAAGATIIFLGAIGVAAAQIEPEERAMATVAGVHVTITADAWTGLPPDIGDIEPLLVTIENNSPVPIRIRYDQFAAVGPMGDRMRALPPFEIRGTEWVSPYYFPGAYPFAADRFWVAPYLGGYYGFRPWGSFLYDPWYYSAYYPSWRVGLPTQDMLAQALPEGVVEPGGKIAGFLYIEDNPKDGEHSRFVYEVVNAETNERLGQVDVPIEID
ncbi:MAG: hypothetical protein EHM55_04050 [Acidobacteria bacterium]|nr:MAG: hypothetical protein EHM55_04050 [Acidobacteriota bacterium]